MGWEAVPRTNSSSCWTIHGSCHTFGAGFGWKAVVAAVAKSMTTWTGSAGAAGVVVGGTGALRAADVLVSIGVLA